MHVIGFYAGLLSFLFVYLCYRTINLRLRLKVAVGDGGNEELLRAMRVQANFAEYAPLAIILLMIMSLTDAPHLLLHLLGCLLVAGRFLHAYGVSHVNEDFRFRRTGMIATFFTILLSASWLLVTTWC